MSSENVGVNEYPDRVGFKPDNPYLKTFRPYIPANVKLRELTPLPLIVGTLLGIVFGASSLYLVLKVGLTVSASIPVAVISITIFRGYQSSDCATNYPGKQHRSDCRLGRRVDRVRAWRDDARNHDPGV